MTVTQPDHKIFFLYPGQVLTITADSVSAGTVWRLGDNAGDPSQGSTAISASESHTFGPFANQARFDVAPSAGSLTGAVGLSVPGSTLQAYDVDLQEIADASPTNGDVIQRKLGVWTNRSMAQVKTDLVLVKADVGLGNVDNVADASKPVSTAQAAADTAVQSAASTDATTKAAAAQAAAIAAAATDATTKANAAQANAIAASLPAPIVTPSTPATGDTVSASTGKVDETLYITPAGTLLALTVALPTSANSRVGQIIRGFISQIITGLTVSVSGSGTVIGSTPVTSAVNSTFAYQCVSVSGAGTWIRIS